MFIAESLHQSAVSCFVAVLSQEAQQRLSSVLYKHNKTFKNHEDVLSINFIVGRKSWCIIGRHANLLTCLGPWQPLEDLSLLRRDTERCSVPPSVLPWWSYPPPRRLPVGHHLYTKQKSDHYLPTPSHGFHTYPSVSASIETVSSLRTRESLKEGRHRRASENEHLFLHDYPWSRWIQPTASLSSREKKLRARTHVVGT